MLEQLEEKLMKGFKFIDLNNRKWFMKSNGTIFALNQENSDYISVLYADTVMNAAIQIYNKSEPISLNQDINIFNLALSEIIQSI